MINTSQTTLNAISVHGVGNKNNEGALRLSDQPLVVEGTLLNSLLISYFLSNFRILERFTFPLSDDQDDLEVNPVMKAVNAVFKDPDSLHEHSVRLAEHLFEITQHPNIKAGELYTVHFSDVEVDGQLFEALGIFKSETKDKFIKVKESKKGYALSPDEGININKLDKGCLILKDAPDDGYRILLVDNANRTDAHFWKDDFLGVRPLQDAFHHTKNFMNLASQYVGDQLEEEFSVSKADKIDLLNRSMDFFKSRDQFNQKEYETEVLEDKSVIESFRKYEQTFITDADIASNFEISAQAVKRQAKVFKSVLKLDKNFHIYVHGNRELIEKGYDETTRRHFYKLYFDQES